MRLLSLSCLFFFFSLSLSRSFEVKESAKPKCGDLDNFLWELMHKWDFCELKKLPKRPQCGEGRKKCGLPGSHCDDGVCSTACGVGKPQCPDGFRCENGECEGEDREEEHEKGSPVDSHPENLPEPNSSPENLPGPKDTTSANDDGKVGAGSCVDENCKEEGCHQTRIATDGPCIDTPGQRRNQTSPASKKAPQNSGNGDFIPYVKGTNKQTNRTAKALKKSSSKKKPKPAMDQLPNLPGNSAEETLAEKYGLCNVSLGQDGVCKSADQICVRQPKEDCKGSNSGCVKVVDEAGICIGTCNGFLGRSCASGLQCVDDPRDGCDPLKWGADCIGICVEKGWPVMRSDGSWGSKTKESERR